MPSRKLTPVLIVRRSSSDQGTFGTLVTRGFSCHTLELPWRENARSISCIPAGEYKAKYVQTNTFGRTYLLRDVPGRSAILIHAGNFAGDKSMGYRTNSAGCILLGNARGIMRGQQVVFSSRFAVSDLLDTLEGKDIEIHIRGLNHNV